MDIVGYTKFASDVQSGLVQQLRAAVRNSVEFKRARAAGSLICIPTGDGMALVYLDNDVCAPIRTAIEIEAALRDGAVFGLRIGLHSGPVFRVPDINGTECVAGAGVNYAQRVMDCADAGHILMSHVHASFLREFENLRSHLREVGEAEIKHGERLQLVSYFDGRAGCTTVPSKLAGRPGKKATFAAQPRPGIASDRPSGPWRVALLYKRHAEPDETLLHTLESELKRFGCDVFIDRHVRVGLDWAKEIEHALRTADAVIPLLSADAVKSEMLTYELEMSDDASQKQNGRPRLLPIRVNWEGRLPEGINKILDPIQYVLWRGPDDTGAVVAELTAALSQPTAPEVRRMRALEPPGGAMPLDSVFYVERSNDADCHQAIGQGVSFVLLEGARQTGKTSLLSRGLQKARESGARVACVDLQAFSSSDLASSEAFFITLGTALANQLDLDVFPEDVWRTKSGANENFTRYLRREVLGKLRSRLVWGLDELDRLFSTGFCSEVCGLFRSWHNARASDPEGPWRNLTQILCYATEAHLLIPDLNQSPFNVGVRIPLYDFSDDEVRHLNRLYGDPLADAEIARFQLLLGGQPYLARRGLNELVARKHRLDDLIAIADQDDGPFSDHLKRFLVLISRTPKVLHAVQLALDGRKDSDEATFNRLRASGLMRGPRATEGRFRCEIYRSYLKRHLSNEPK
ncbi:MAG: AAA-like domain-containing protein, partial [Chthoniobacteraceae bacterium]